MIKIQLMTTTACHLCEQAKEMLDHLFNADLQLKNTMIVEMVEIANDDALIEKYGIRIPVLLCREKELAWPFELPELHQWLLQE